MTQVQDVGYTQWARALIGFEIVLWDQLEARLRERCDISLVMFEALNFVQAAADSGLRVGQLASRLHMTVGGTSKLVDRLEGEGYIQRVADGKDRRASTVVVTETGRNLLIIAAQTYETAIADMTGSVMTASERLDMYLHLLELTAAAKQIGKEEQPA